MRRLLAILIGVLLATAPAAAGGDDIIMVDGGMKWISSNEYWGEYSWKITIRSEAYEGRIRLNLVFKDAEGFEMQSVEETVWMHKGDNTYTGRQMCSDEVCDKIHTMQTYITEIDKPLPRRSPTGEAGPKTKGTDI